MHPWSPDDLYAQSIAVATSDEFVGSEETADSTKDFVEDFPHDGLGSFLNRLELPEREMLFQLVRDDLHKEIVAEVEARQSEQREEERAVTEALALRLEEKVDEELLSIARNALELSITMAEQITRQTIELDRDALQKAVDTVVYRAKRGTKFTVVVNPEDASNLESRPDEMSRLGIEKIDVDQRIERGGCLIEADCQEWDYTVSGRLEQLSAVVRESILESPTVTEEPT